MSRTGIDALFYCAILLRVLVVGERNTQHVDITAHPYQVSIQKDGKHICSGALLHESWVVTVGSCVHNVQFSDIKIRVRTSNLETNGDDLTATEVAVHPSFDKYAHFNDIALIKLTTPAEFGEKLLPIGLPEHENYTLKDETICFVTGWKRKPGGHAECRLTVTAVPLVNQDTCISVMPQYKPVSEMMVCAGNMTHGVETCQGDVGAPLMTDQTLIGVLSYGLGCETMIHPGVYTRISTYLPWISANSGIKYMR